MNLSSSILFGTIQGLTEFLPVSSSGHLVLAQSIMPGFSQPGVLFDVTLHMGTLLAVLVYFRRKLFQLSMNYIIMIVIGTIPAVLAGLLLGDAIEGLFSDAKLVGFMLVLTGMMNFLTDKKSFDIKNKFSRSVTAFLIGIFQAFAITPGISRSGSTIFAGSKLGMDKKKAAEFSFLLSVPAVFGANIYEILKLHSFNGINVPAYFFGFLFACMAGLVSIKFVFKTLLNQKFKYFAYYCIALGLLVIIL